MTDEAPSGDAPPAPPPAAPSPEGPVAAPVQSEPNNPFANVADVDLGPPDYSIRTGTEQDWMKKKGPSE
jgi:hypothetical protein